MRPFGSLPRPTSRFERPRCSWTRRLFLAGKLRVGFLLVWGLVAGMAMLALRGIGREYGYFYSTAERVELWERLPEGRAAGTLEAIYSNDPHRPEAVIARHATDPTRSEPEFTALLEDVHWGAKARLAENGDFDFALRRLMTGWDFRRFESLLVASHQGQRLNSVQRGKLDMWRREAAKAMMRVQPENDQQTKELCDQTDLIMRRPGRLTPHWYNFMKYASQQRQVELLTDLARVSDRPRQIKILRKLVLLTHLGEQEFEVTRDIGRNGRALAHQLAWEARQPGYNFEDSLRVLAYYRALVPTLEVKRLAAELTPEQRDLLNLFVATGLD
ncbi:MAG: hypothetical protein J0I12_17525 [Candidatus Eremiobacteraeota bacterium]|nr:hypothetical protein [Candidatus Eremiobacteraeota bacterium]